ncbi:MAG: M67 family metallopeptidase [Anaerolineae bacterium]|nr:M67 family metallopeptidase [Anaerolineae bacterium]
MLHITQLHLKKIHAHLEAGYPNEACGILIGDIDSVKNDIKTVRDVVLVQNAWEAVHEVTERESQHNRYLINPDDIARADREAAKKDWDIIGFFHSHPDDRSRPSETDREWAWPVISFVIVSVQKGVATTTQSWVLRDDRTQFDEEALATA